MNKSRILNDLRVTGIEQQKTGLLVLVSSPSGGGKTTVIRELLKKFDYCYSISMTTRQPRNGEIDGIDYQFVAPDTFQEYIKNDQLLEFEQVHDYYYGTPSGPVIKWLKEGKVVILDVDVKGAMQLKKQYPDNTMLIFLKPPDLDTLKKRLVERSTESDKQIAKRLQRVDQELGYSDQFDHVIINNTIDETVNSVESVINYRLNNH